MATNVKTENEEWPTGKGCKVSNCCLAFFFWSRQGGVRGTARPHSEAEIQEGEGSMQALSAHCHATWCLLKDFRPAVASPLSSNQLLTER